MDFINSLFHYFTDRSRRVSRKAFLILFVFAFLVLIDNTLSFSYNYNNQKKIELVDGISKVLNDSTISEVERAEFVRLRKEIIFKKTWKDKTWDWITHFEFKENTDLGEVHIEVNGTDAQDRSYYWHFFTSTWSVLVIMILLLFAGVFDKETSLGKTLVILLFVEALLFAVAIGLAKLLSLVPILFDSPVWNYVLNFIVGGVILLIFAYLAGSDE